MAKKLNNRHFLLSTLILIVSLGAQAQEEQGTGAFLDGIVAVVNEGVVLRSELDRQVDAISTQLLVNDVELPPQDVLEQQILERLVIEEIQIQRADRLGIQITDDMLNAGISRVAQRAGITLNQLLKYLLSRASITSLTATTCGVK